MVEHIEDVLETMSHGDFEVETPGVFFKCESAVFMTGNDGSLCYTTSVGRAEILATILNDWARLRIAEKTK